MTCKEWRLLEGPSEVPTTAGLHSDGVDSLNMNTFFSFLEDYDAAP